MHAREPIGGPTQLSDQFAWQAKRQIEPADPRRGLVEPIAPSIERFKAQQAVELHALIAQRADGDDDGFAFAGAAGDIATQQKRLRRGQ